MWIVHNLFRAGHTTIIWIRQKAVSPSKLLAKLLVKLQLPKNAAGAVLQASRKLTPPSRTGKVAFFLDLCDNDEFAMISRH